MGRLIDLSGKRFGRLLAIERVEAQKNENIERFGNANVTAVKKLLFGQTTW